MQHSTTNNENPSQDICRSVTAEEVAHYKEFGWVKLTKFLNPAIVAMLLKRARGQMGENATGHSIATPDFAFFNPEPGGGRTDPEMRAMIDRVGPALRQLLDRGPEVGLRYFNDLFTPKLPSAKRDTHTGAGATKFHQDFITWGLDRSGGMTMWVALEDLTAEFGTMSFVNRSHRAGTLGDYSQYGDKDTLDFFPSIRADYSISEPMTYTVGDVTVHDNMTVHGAGPNLTDRPRWTYILTTNPSDALWTGAPTVSFDWRGMTVFQPLDDERFPIIG